jgi:NADPH2:quinone reductase
VGKVHRIPEGVSFEQAAGLNIPYGTAYRALFQKANVKAGEKVLVHGASGGVGTAAVQWAKAAGVKVIGTAGTEKGLELVRAEGADHALNHKNEGYREEVMKITGGKGVDVILEMLANVNLGNDLTMLARNGRVVVIGSRGKVEINPRDAMGREATIMGLMLFLATPQEYGSIHAAIYAGLASGTLRPIVGKKFPLAEADKAHEAVMAAGAYGKIVLIP